MSDENAAPYNVDSGNKSYTREEVVHIKANLLAAIDKDSIFRANTAYIAKALFNIDQRLTAETAKATIEGIKALPEMSPEQEDAFRLKMLKNAIESVNPQNYPEHSLKKDEYVVKIFHSYR